MRRTLSWWSVLLLSGAFACDGADTGVVDEDGDGVAAGVDCDDADALVGGPATWYVDLDHDTFGSSAITQTTCEQPAGYVATATDCSDEDPASYPGAVESCDGRDNDCDTVVDDNAPDGAVWYPDLDGDGYGDSLSPVVSCYIPEGLLADGTDCDDAIATIFPGADEWCNGADDDCNGVVDDDALDATALYADVDGDSFGDPDAVTLACEGIAGLVLDSSDCDDHDPSVNPLGTEVCGGADEDCDGWVDDDDDVADPLPWHVDVDGDGHGNPNVTWYLCVQPAGFVPTADDCDDTEDYVYPGAMEICDGEDEDCNGVVDDNAVDSVAWFPDADLDGYGDPAGVIPVCEAPAGYVLDGTDCDDRNLLVNPGMPELCAVGDEDCDGLDADADPSVSDPLTWYVDADGDRYGTSTITVLACLAAGSERGDDCDDGDATVHPEAEDVCEDGLDQDCLGGDQACSVSGEWSLVSSDATFTADSGGLGIAVDGGKDIDGDGTDDVVLGATLYQGGARNSGAAVVMRSPSSGDLDADTDGVLLLGISEGDEAGMAVAMLGDLDGDGLGEVLVGAPSVGPNQSGAAYLFYGGSLPAAGSSLSLSAADATFPGENEWDETGDTLAAVGDVDGDGVEDFVIGATADYSGGYHAGSFVVVYGAAFAGNVDLSLFPRVLGNNAGDHLAGGIAGAGDFDGDGLDDILVGAEGEDRPTIHSGAAYVALGPADSLTLVEDADLILEAEDPLDEAGTGVAGLGDTNGDGYVDIAVGAPANQRGGFEAGTTYIFLGPRSGTVSMTLADAIVTGATEGAAAGEALDGPGDIDADGYDDVMIGSPRDSTVSHYSGAAYLLYGPLAGSMSLADADAHMVGNGGAGTSVAGAGDTDADGFMDVLLGGTEYGAGGRVWLVAGRVR